mgnify:CR=1 FL=1
MKCCSVNSKFPLMIDDMILYYSVVKNNLYKITVVFNQDTILELTKKYMSLNSLFIGLIQIHTINIIFSFHNLFKPLILSISL